MSGLNLSDKPVSYSIEIGFNPQPLGFHVVREALRTESGTIYETTKIQDGSHWVCCGDARIRFNTVQPVLTQLDPRRRAWPARMLSKVTELRVPQLLADMRFWDLSPQLMRSAAFPGTPLGDRGDSLPAVLEDICADPARRSVLATWLRELTPMDLSDFEFPHDPSGLVHLSSARRTERKYLPIARRTALCVSWRCWRCCSGRNRRACVSSRRRTSAFMQRANRCCWSCSRRRQ